MEKERGCLFCEIANEREIDNPFFLGFETKDVGRERWVYDLLTVGESGRVDYPQIYGRALNEPQLAMGPGKGIVLKRFFFFLHTTIYCQPYTNQCNIL